MSGYREHGFVPNSYEQPGRPLRPFNWVQWSGVGLMAFGLALDLLYFAGRFGWTKDGAASPAMALGPMFVGIALINSRREPGTLVTDEQRARNRKVLLITVAILAVLGAALLVIEFSGV